MNSINQLHSLDTFSTSDQMVFWSSKNGNTYRGSVAEFVAFVAQQNGPQGYTPAQYAAPNASGFNVNILPATPGGSVALILTPLAGYAAGVITLPAQATAADGQELSVSTTQAVTVLTVAGNGATVNGAPTALAANGFFRLRYDAVNQSWYRVG